MFFKRAAKDKLKSSDSKSAASNVIVAPAERREAPAVAAETLTATEPKPNGGIASDAPARAAPLPANFLRRATNPAILGFETTAQLDDHAGLPGQEQALAALSATARMRSRGHNIVVLGATGTAAIDLVLAEIQAVAVNRPPPSDWVYVANFEDRHAPRVLELPAGYGRTLAAAMDEAVDEMRSAIISTLAGDGYQTRWRAIDAEFYARHQEALAALARTADAHSIALLRTPMGYAVAPGHDGGVVSPETFNNMPPSMQADVRAQISALEADLSQMLENSPQVDRQRRARLSKLNREVMAGVARAALAEPRRMFAAFEGVLSFLDAVEADAVAGANFLLPTIDIPDILGAERLAKIDEARLDAYRVNVFVAWPAEVDAAPVLQELAPGEAALFGTSTPEVGSGAQHMHFKAGLLHRANGGFLLLDAGALTASPPMLSALLSAIAAGAVRPRSDKGAQADPGALAQPIPLDVKIILLSDAKNFPRVLADFPRFRELFSPEVRLTDHMERSTENEGALGRAIAGIARQEGLEPFEAGAVAELIELSSRLAGARGELSLALDELCQVARLADECRAAASRATVGREDVSLAWSTRQQWARGVTPPPQDSSTEGRIQWLTKGPTVGMAIRLLGRSAERPIPGSAGPAFRRVSARIQWGLLKPASVHLRRVNHDTRRTSAERTIAAYLAAEFGRDPLAISAGLDSGVSPLESADETYATCAELMALLSAIADLRLSQTIAVAGTVDQFGRLRSQRGINEAIEEYFDACRACAVMGSAGVVIPASCKSQLMLRHDIVEAAAVGEFSIWALDTAADCFALLTGLPAGTRDGERFADGDAYRLVADGLQKLRAHTKPERQSDEASDA